MLHHRSQRIYLANTGRVQNFSHDLLVNDNRKTKIQSIFTYLFSIKTGVIALSRVSVELYLLSELCICEMIAHHYYFFHYFRAKIVNGVDWGVTLLANTFFLVSFVLCV